eukprot:scaffold1140_cov251-Pinguiococcus_pyrenoidosus.AAC.17
MENCVLRIRYNISTGDLDQWPEEMDGTPEMVDWRNNSQIGNQDNPNSPLEQDPYALLPGITTSPDSSFLSFAVNTNQYARTFQVRKAGDCAGRRTRRIRQLTGRCSGIGSFLRVQHSQAPDLQQRERCCPGSRSRPGLAPDMRHRHQSEPPWKAREHCPDLSVRGVRLHPRSGLRDLQSLARRIPGGTRRRTSTSSGLALTTTLGEVGLWTSSVFLFWFLVVALLSSLDAALTTLGCNNGEGGPPDPNDGVNTDQDNSRADRTNLAFMTTPFGEAINVLPDIYETFSVDGLEAYGDSQAEWPCTTPGGSTYFDGNVAIRPCGNSAMWPCGNSAMWQCGNGQGELTSRFCSDVYGVPRSDVRSPVAAPG